MAAASDDDSLLCNWSPGSLAGTTTLMLVGRLRDAVLREERDALLLAGPAGVALPAQALWDPEFPDSLRVQEELGT